MALHVKIKIVDKIRWTYGLLALWSEKIRKQSRRKRTDRVREKGSIVDRKRHIGGHRDRL